MMRWIRILLVWLGWHRGLEQIDREIDRELRFHLDMRIQANLAKGMSEEEARADALRRLGDTREIRRRGRLLLAASPPPRGERTWTEILTYELRLAARSLMRRPLLAGPAVMSLGLGIAIAMSVFWVADTVTFRPLPFEDGERMIVVWHIDPERGWDEAELSARDFLDFRTEVQSAELAGFWPTSLNLAEAGTPERVAALRVTANLFHVLGIEPALGRGFVPDEETAGRSPVVILSDALGTRRFGTAAEALGATVRLDGIQRTVVGVLPPDLPAPFHEAGAWIPLELDRLGNRQARGMLVVGRLRKGFAMNDADEEVSALARVLAASYPESNRGLDARAAPFRTFLFPEDVQVGSLVLLAASLAVLLIAAANVLNLLLAGATGRRRELVIRSALGGSRAQVARQLMTESVLLGLAGGGLGVLISLWGVHLIRIQAGASLADAVGVEGRVLLVAVMVSVLTGIAVGSGPALTGTRWVRAHGLSAVGRGLLTDGKESATQKLLVVSQMTLAVILLATTVFAGRIFLSHRSEDLGFRTGDLLTFRTTLDAVEYPDDGEVGLFFHRLLAEVRALPEVERASAVSLAPLTDMNTGHSYLPEGEDHEPGRWPLAPFRVVTEGYFRTLEIPLVAGRAFTSQDGAGTAPVVVVSRSLARRHWADADAVGKRLQLDGIGRTIVGVTGDVHLFGPETPPTQVIYLPLDQFPRREMDLVLRTSDVEATALAVREVMHRIDPHQPVFSIQTMESRRADEIRGDRLATLVVGTAGTLAFLLAVVGVYGVIAHWSARRRGQTGIRIALGASRRDVLVLVLRQGLSLSATGAALGAGLMVVVWWPLSSAILESPSFNPLPILSAGALAVLGGACAAFMPALRASRIDPADTLRQE